MPTRDTSDPALHAGIDGTDEPIRRSLFGEILDWMLVPLLLLWPMSIAITYLVAKSIANQPFDRALDDSVTVLSQQVREVDSKVVALLPGAARDILRADEIDTVYYQVRDVDGDYVDGDHDMSVPADEENAPTGTVQFRDDRIHGTDVRIAYVQVDLRPSRLMREQASDTISEPRMALVQVGETLDKRARLANDIIKGVILPQFIILPVALALVWFALARGLAPLAELQQRIRARRPDDLSPIDSGQVPEEISPLVRSLNDMLERLSQTIDLQKRFIADAAHQMKTPLAGMRMQSELALRQTSQDEIHRSLEQLSKSSEAATRLINQLLSLAHAENRSVRARAFEPIELCELARTVVQDWVPAALARQIDIGFEQPGHPVMTVGNAMLLRELLSNLIDNALRYTPSLGSVTIRVRIDEGRQQAMLEIEDTGPGIAAAERSHIFERFYRILGSNVEGSGLGLAIVREIALQHDAEIDVFSNPHSHDPKIPGSLFRVALPMVQPLSFIEDIG
ncbi:sensor histidine kinase N-terminal domain-containing protein [Actimicrobium sp. CCC2.4]|uniref:sensor histidine kinase n=1 Tax=Actimicrobium sp. CCC2.4 TaxID=3048606 RepID=UPI002AC97E74|nr:sensor histidine kinase N-terminal domain-containing protein [Actimicrobium sp. CCC2.4]MEB0136091.1 sensor histidine kinase N-terminal domain-containing protein [Actimicrobium sp. CCC2.4]WPX32151.1 sensor histidine kinase N-terminal domain-containing protein [Actimicrobium sp. CCC2.4]